MGVFAALVATAPAAAAPTSSCPVTHTTNTTAACPSTGDTTPMQGQALDAGPGTWTGSPTYAYQWQTCSALDVTTCTPLAGENESRFIVPLGLSARLRVVVTATDPSGSDSRASAITAVTS